MCGTFYIINNAFWSYIELCETTQMRLVALATVYAAFDNFLVLFGYCYGRQRNSSAAGDGHTDSRDGIFRARPTTKVTIGRQVVHRGWRKAIGMLGHCCGLADGTLVKRDMVLNQVKTE